MNPFVYHIHHHKAASRDRQVMADFCLSRRYITVDAISASGLMLDASDDEIVCPM